MPGVTKEQIQAAREADLFTYLQFHEPGVLKRDGPNFRHKEHDSLVYVTGKRYWYWNSRGRSINALDYLIQIRGYGLVDAVHALVGGEIRHTPAYRSTAEIQVSKEPEKKAFSLPWARRCATAAVSYLQKRGISSEVIRQCLQAGIFYEARYHGEPVCVFVGKDDSGKAKFACMRSIGGNLKKDVYGSDKGYNFCYPPQSPGSRHVAVFEAPIDMLIFLTLYPKDWQKHSYIAMNGVYENAVLTALKNHSNLSEVILCVDNDEGGIEAVDRLRDILRENGYENVRRFAPKFKDWNEDLKAKNGAKFLPAVPHKRKEEYLKEVSELVYLKCRPDKLTSQIYATFKNRQYKYLAEYALASSAFFIAPKDENLMFEKLKFKLKDEYKPYTDKGKKAQKQRALQECMQEVLRDLKRTACTREQSVLTAKMLYQLADSAVRLSIEETLSEPVAEHIESEDIVCEPEPCMEFG